MNTLFEQLLFSASITGPICLMLFLGVFLKRIQLINENFIDIASKLVFQVTLPAMLFLSIVQSDHDFVSSGGLVLFGLVINALFFIITAIITKKVFSSPKDQGVIIQGSFRANTAIIGLAYVANIYGASGVALAAVYVASMTVLYNIQAVIALSQTDKGFGAQAVKVIGKTLTRNPLIISILLGVIAFSLSIPIPQMAIDAGQYFADMTLPLALLCTGGSLNIQSLKHDKFPTWFATCFKLILAPITATLAAIAFGFNGQELGLIFLMAAAPTAAASYVMASSMGGNSTLAANIIALTTVLSLVTCTIGIFALSTLKLI
ncbi:AEC family transporter [Vibrio kyushuensis]|uniref:AEC family transporter n=1 Tax=Vibrio kyushuensis TaxID=2910249 RepID=UPI003D0C9EF6